MMHDLVAVVLVSGTLFATSALAGVSSTMPDHTYNGRQYKDWSYDFRDNGSIDLPGRLYVPTNYDASKSYPLIVFFHGNGEKGTNNTSQLNGHIINLLATAAQKNAFVYVPQMSSSWSNSVLENVTLQIANTRKHYSIDAERLYITGYSLGGFGVWGVGGMNADAAAALVAVAPSQGNLADVNAKELAGKPVWIFRNFDDTTVGASHPRNRARQILREGGFPNFTYPADASGYPINLERNNLRYSENPTGGHGAARDTFGRADLNEWLYSQKTTDGYLAKDEKIRVDFGSVQVADVTSVQTTSTTTQAYTGRRPDSTGAIWNSTTANFGGNKDAAIAFARTTEGRSTFASVFVEGTFTDYNRAASPQTLFDANIGRDGWRTLANQSATIQIDGLTPNGLYDIEIFASTEQTSADVRFSRYQIGELSRTLEVAGNQADAALFQRIAADQQGRLSITVSGANGSSYGHLGTLTLTATVPEPSAAIGALSGLAIANLQRRRSHDRR